MEFFHVLNRGVDKRKVFLNKKDYMRFMRDLYIFNDKNYAPHCTGKNIGLRRKRKPLVQIHAFCLMPNHYHILLSPIDDDLKNLSLFMQKLNMGYSKYFNEKYERVGTLWQGKYKKVHIWQDSHFLWIPYYIHLNPLDMHSPEWRKGGVKSIQESIKYLNNYKWSSHLDYSGIRNYPSIIEPKILTNIFNGSAGYKKELKKSLLRKEFVEENWEELE